MVYSRIFAYLPLLSAVAIVPFLITTGHSQVMVPSAVINCTIYNSSLPCLPGDRSVFCLTNGSTVRGICDAQKAVCEENEEVADSMTPCLITTTLPPNNTAISFVTHSNHHRNLQVFSSSVLVWIWLAYSP